MLQITFIPGMRKERLHILLTESEFRMLKSLSETTGRPVSELVREAIGRSYAPSRNIKPLEAAAGLKKMQPVDAEVFRSLSGELI